MRGRLGRDRRPVAPKVRRADLRVDFWLVAYPRAPWLGDVQVSSN